MIRTTLNDGTLNVDSANEITTASTPVTVAGVVSEVMEFATAGFK